MASELESRIKELGKGRRDTDVENIKRDIKIYELKAEVAKLRRDQNLRKILAEITLFFFSDIMRSKYIITILLRRNYTLGM